MPPMRLDIRIAACRSHELSKIVASRRVCLERGIHSAGASVS